MSAATTREDINLPFWRQAGFDARAAGLARSANPFLHLAAPAAAHQLPFEITSACSGSWIQGWNQADESIFAMSAGAATA